MKRINSLSSLSRPAEKENKIVNVDLILLILQRECDYISLAWATAPFYRAHLYTTHQCVWSQNGHKRRLSRDWENGLEPQTIHLELASGCFFLYFEIDSIHGCFSEVNLCLIECTIDLMHYHHHSPASARLHSFNQWLCVGFKTSALRRDFCDVAKNLIPDPYLTSHSMQCFPTHPPALIPLVL